MNELLATSQSALSYHLPAEVAAFVYGQLDPPPTLDSSIQRLRQLSLAALRTSAIIWTLYVPDVPLDPAIAAMAKLQFLEKKEARLMERIRSLSEYDPAIRYSRYALLWEELCQVRNDKKEQQPITIHRKSTPAELVALYREMQRSYDQFLQPKKVTAAFTAGDADRSVRVTNLCTSLQAAILRLQTVYSNYGDLIKPALLCYNATIIGLAALKRAQESETRTDERGSVVREALQHLCQAPLEAVKSDLVSDQAWQSVSSVMRPLCLPLLRLQAFGMLSAGDIASCLPQIEAIYEDLHRYWKTWQAQTLQREDNAKSLYKSRFQISSDAAEDIDDEKLADREVLELFGITDLIAPRPSLTDSAQEVPALTPSDFVRIATAHIAMFGNTPEQDKKIDVNFAALHVEAVQQLVEKHASETDDSLDQLSKNLQLDMLATSSEQTQSSHAAISFYHSADPKESTAVAEMLEGLLAAVRHLQDEWPEQMILVDIGNRADQVLALRTDLSVARLLGAMEHVLPAIDDWQQVSSKEYSLALHQNALVQRIIRYRQLELESWPNLLDIEDQSFSDRSHEYWMPLYENVVQAPFRIIQDPAGDIQSHLRELAAIIDSFLRESPVGQYRQRLLLLSSFASYARASPDLPSSIPSLLSSMHCHYSRSLQAVEDWKSEQRAKVSICPSLFVTPLTKKGE